jgi:hypothetical protein
MQNAPSQSLLSLVNAILGGKPMEEVPMVSPKVPRLLTFFCPCDPVQDVQFYTKIGVATKVCFVQESWNYYVLFLFFLGHAL